MKTYLLDSITRYKRFSENLDVKTVLCNKSWWVFNDSGEKEIYIFQEDGSLIISVNGQVTFANWKFISANKSLIINTAKQSVMVHSAFMDNVLFALQLDGTNNFAFLIDESQRDSFHPKSLDDVKNYFVAKELRGDVEKIKQIEQARLEKNKQIEEINKRKLQVIANEVKISEHYKKWKKFGRSWFNSGYFVLGTILCRDIFSLLDAKVGVEIIFWFENFMLLLCVVSCYLWIKSYIIKKFKLIIRGKNGEYTLCESSQYNFYNFNQWCLKQAFSTFKVPINNNKVNILSYLQGDEILEISYMYKVQQIAVDSYDLDSIN